MDNPSAFPVYPRIEGNTSKEIKGATGMTLRDYFAGQALIGIFHRADMVDYVKNKDTLALRCYEMADAMLKERGNNGQDT